ncbi:MAG: MgtC/SapB family protein [Anaerolineaceae bacterium]|nr:MAG: MgtC/SapB family protein [Anaerolineaceae bacterium]
MTMVDQLTIIFYVLIAAMLSALIGLERERRSRSAGLRTHMLVGVGACLFTSLSAMAFPGGDPTRIASNVVTGIGFLGAGVIFRNKNAVHDLTTAASIWATAAIGMAVGIGAWLSAFGVTVIIWLILALLRKLPIYEQHGKKKFHSKWKARAKSSDD